VNRLSTPVAAVLAALLLAGCSRREAPPPPPAFEATRSVLPVPAAVPPQVPVPAGEPPEADVVRLYTEEIDAVRAAGGLPLVVTATGTRITVMPTLHRAWKDDCRRVPQSAPGHWECSLTVKLALERVDPEGMARRRRTNEPSVQGARVFVRWDAAAGRWVRG
jgi:hypothetical protein